MTSSQKKPIEWTDKVLEEAINGVFTVTRMNQDVPYKLTEQEKQAFKQSKQQGYVVVGRRNNLRNAFCQWCEIHHEPYIYIEQRGKHAHVTMDLIFCEDHTYQGDRLFEAKLQMVATAVEVKPDFTVGGTYSYINVLPEHADYMARSFLAIYRQHLGMDVKVPAFPEGTEHAPMFSQFQALKEQKYISYSRGRQGLLWKWEIFCEAYHWPYIRLNEKRKGSAIVEVNFPTSTPLRADVEQAIIEAAHKIGLKTERAKYTDKGIIFVGPSIRMPHMILVKDATNFAEDIVTILDTARYFLAVDESWHE